MMHRVQFIATEIQMGETSIGVAKATPNPETREPQREKRSEGDPNGRSELGKGEIHRGAPGTIARET